eukprot:488966_1
MLQNEQAGINNSDNTDKKSPLVPCEEQSDYAAINNNTNSSKCTSCSRNKYFQKAQCCNRWMCGCICLIIVFLIIICILISIFAIAPLFRNIEPKIQNVYIQLFDYELHEKQYLDIPKVFVNGSGAFGVEVYNNNPMGFYMHDWSVEALSLNLYHNTETWGDVYCCSSHPKWNKTFPYYKNYTWQFDNKFWINSKKSTNMSFILFVTDLDEELFYAGWEASWLNNWKLSLGLNGNGWGKTKFLGIDIKIMLDCSIIVNASYFFPFHPPHRNKSYFKDVIGRVPPKKYVWQKFPVLELNCTFGFSSFKFG